MDYIFVSKRLILFLTPIVLLTCAGSAFADDGAQQKERPLVVAGVRGGAWKCLASDPSVRSSVKPGDILKSGDRLETFQGNEVQVALDDRGQDLVALQGAFKIRQDLKGTDFQLDRGRALAVLDGLKGKSEFSVSTPTGVAVVRGTRFGVDAPLSVMDVKTFKGEVFVQEVSAQAGRRVGGGVLVTKGHKTRVNAGAGQPLTLAELSARDTKEYQEAFTRIRDTRKSMRMNGRKWFLASEDAPRSVSVPAAGDGRSASKQENGAIVF